MMFPFFSPLWQSPKSQVFDFLHILYVYLIKIQEGSFWTHDCTMM